MGTLVCPYVPQIVAMQDCYRYKSHGNSKIQHLPINEECAGIDRSQRRQKGVCDEYHKVTQGLVFQIRIKDRAQKPAESDVKQRHSRPQPQGDSRNRRNRKQAYGEPQNFLFGKHPRRQCFRSERVIRIDLPAIVKPVAPCVASSMEHHYVQQSP